MSRGQFKLALALGALAALVYALTAPPGISWKHSGEDGPEFAAIGICLGISHPTGYPLYALLLRLATMAGGVLGFEPARAAGILSQMAAGAAVAAAALFFMALLRAARGRYYQVWGGFVGAALFAASPAFWSQATIIEVYPLHLLLSGLILFTAVTWRGRPRRLLVLGFLIGLGFAHHMQTFLLLPSVALLVLAGGRLSLRPLLAAAAAATLPLTLYLVLPLRSRLDPPLDWGNPETLRQLAWVVSGAQYRFRMFRDDFPEVLRRAVEAVTEGLPDAFGWSALPLALLGVAVLFIRGRRLLPALVALYLLPLAWAVNYSIPDPEAYHLPSLLACAGAIGTGAGWLLQRGFTGRSRLERSLALLGFGLALTQPLLRLPDTWRRNDLSADREALRYARTAIGNLPERALVLSEGDGRTFALWYEQVRQGRFDAIVIYRPLLQWAWCLENLRRLHPDLVLPDSIRKPEAMERALLVEALGRRPVYTAYSDHRLAAQFVHRPVARLFRVDTLRTPVTLPSWAGMTAEPLPLSAIANADWRFDPFAAVSRERRNPFPELAGGRLLWGDVPFEFPLVGDGWQPNCVTTCGVPGYRGSLLLHPARGGGVALLLSGRGLDGERNASPATLEVEYSDGTVERRPLRPFVDVWNFDSARQQLARPQELETATGATAIFQPFDSTRTVFRLTLLAHAAQGEEWARPGVAILGATQLLPSNSAR